MTLYQAKKKGLHLCKPFLYLVHSGGFEPPTARFVAEYSIQLSYECIGIFNQITTGCSDLTSNQPIKFLGVSPP